MHQHESRSAAQAGAKQLQLVLLLTASYTAVEVAGGLLTGSLALLADAGHMLADVTALSMALAAIKLASRPPNDQKTYGYYRVEMLAALFNAVLLLGVCAYVLYEAYGRFSDPPEVLAWPMLGVAAVGLLINVGSAYLLLEGQKSSLNLRAAFLEVIGDLLGSVAVIVAGVVLLATGFRLIDPIASLLIGLFILPRTWHLVAEAVHVLLEGVPRSVDMAHVKQHILGADGVLSVHDLHVWNLTSGMNVMSAHVVIKEDASAQAVLDQLTECLDDHFDIGHSTFQIEPVDRSATEHIGH